MDDFEEHLEAMLFISVLKFMRLIGGHPWILVSMKQQQGRVIRADMEYRTGEFCQIRDCVRLCAQ
jgi:hypothetical protein